jgi:hypothetical protein
MARYIDADRLINDVSGNAGIFVFGPKTVMDIVSTINSQPTADVVEVVRCGKCIYANSDGTICHYDVGRDVKPDHYCGYGERKCDNE